MTAKPKVWVARPLFPEVLARLAEFVDVQAEAVEHKHSAAELREKLAHVDGAVLGLSDRIDAAVLEGNHRLKVVANLGVGYNNLDLEAMSKAGVLACNTPRLI